MEPEIKEQLVNTIIKTFAYKKEQAEHLFLELMKCVENKELVHNEIIVILKRNCSFAKKF